MRQQALRILAMNVPCRAAPRGLAVRVRWLSSTITAARRPIAVPTNAPPLAATAPTTPQWEPLERSLKTDRRALLLLSLPIPSSSWPSHLERMSPLLAAASGRLKKERVGVNAYYDGVGTAAPPTLQEFENYPAVLVYPDGQRFFFQHFSSDTLADLERDTTTQTQAPPRGSLAEALAYAPRMDVSLAPPNFLPMARMRENPEILVCTHGARDCRCSDRGGELVVALRKVIAQHKLNIPIREVAHVGGHKWAANALLVPSLDMLSNLSASDAPALIEHVANKRPTYGPVWRHWRGRVGLNDAAQGRVWANILRHLPPDTVFSGPTVGVGQEEGDGPKEGAGKARAAGKDKDAARVPLTFRTFQGEEKKVQACIGDSILEVGKEFDLPSIEGTCGGNLECATCHIYIDPAAPIGPPDDDELDMLGTAIDYKDGPSRLGCQIKVTPELSLWSENGGVIDLPRY